MTMRKALLGLLALTVAVPALPSTAAAQSYRGADYRAEDHNRNGRYDNQDRRVDRREARRADRRSDRRADRRSDRRYARYYNQRGHYNGPSWRGRDGRDYCHRSDGTTGLLIGGVAGALVGRSIDTRGDRTGGTLIGGLLGAVLGSAIDKDSSNGRRCR
jgi:Ni/Co efflux regulator RcnB